MRRISLLSLVVIVACGGDGNKVRISLPLPPKLDLSLYNSIYMGGFVASDNNKDFSTAAEGLNFFKREFIRRGNIDVVEADAQDLSDVDPRDFFEREQAFWSEIDWELDNTGMLVLTGELSYEILDRSAFRQVQSTDVQGNKFYQTRFVEATGYLLKLRVYVYDMSTGNLLYRELLQDEIDVDGPPGDTRLAFNNLLARMSRSVIGLFTHTNVRAERNLL